MKHDLKRAPGLRLEACSYGLSRVRFRGPRRRTDTPYVAVLGGSDTFARQVRMPYPALLEEELGAVCINMGCQNAGPELFLNDSAVAAMVHDARAVVIEVMGAVNQSNRYYRVHPRRNDRFIAPTKALRALYPEVDFTEIAFTGHLVAKLVATDPVRFQQVRKVLQAAWLRRMKALIAVARGSVILLWQGDRSPDDPAVDGAGPDFITRAMLERLAVDVEALIEVPPRRAAGLLAPPGRSAADHRITAEALVDAVSMALV